MKNKENIKTVFNKNKNKRSKRSGKGILIVAILLLAVVAAAIILVYINRFALQVDLRGEAELTIEYGDEYLEEGADAFFNGSLFMKSPKACDVKIKGEVDTKKLGSYVIEYSAEYTLDYYIAEKTFNAVEKRRVNVVDTTAPTIELKHIPDYYTLPGAEYTEEGFTAIDLCDGDLSASVERVVKDGKVYYTVSDLSGNEAQAVRDIFYDDPIPPEIKLLGDWDIVITKGGKYAEPGYKAIDNVDGNLTESVQVSGQVDTSKAGKYTLTYTVTDKYENTASATRDVTVKAPVEAKEGDVLYGAPLNPNGKAIYLTFDDGPGKHTARLLDILDKYGVKATFFVVSTSYLDILPRMAEAGHTVAMHTNTHDYDTIYASEEAYFDDLEAIEGKISEKLGTAPKILRFPGGGSNLISRDTPGIMSTLTAKVKELGYRYYDWNVDSNDAGGTKSADGVYNNVVNGISYYNNSIVLQHDIYGYSVDAVERIIVWGLENGYTFLPLTENSPVCEHSVKN